MIDEKVPLREKVIDWVATLTMALIVLGFGGILLLAIAAGLKWFWNYLF